jgi:tRNA threonylcarbamoyladenosine biosynthesis protein TsaB
MNILAIDSCTEVCSVSLYYKDCKINRLLKNTNKSSGFILALCDEIFKQSGISSSQLDYILYTKGPGAFTKVRMCVAVAQSIAFVNNIPSMGFSTLELLSFGATKKFNTDKIAVALDARMGEIYWGVYQNNKLTNESLRSPDKVNVLNKDFIGVGNGWEAYTKELIDKTKINNYYANFYPKAEDLIDLSLSYIKKDDVVNNNLPLPTYLRDNIVQNN